MAYRLKLIMPATIWGACAVLFLLFSLLFYQIETQKNSMHIEKAKMLLLGLMQHHEGQWVDQIRKKQQPDLSPFLPLEDTGMIAGICITDSMGTPLITKGAPIQIDSPPINSDDHRFPLFSEATNERNQRRLLFSTHLSDGHKKLGLILIRLNPQAIEGNFPLDLALSVAVVFGLLALVGIYFHIYWHNTVSKPLASLQRALDLARQGELGQPLAIYSNNELGDLATAFNTMSERLKARLFDLAESLEASKAEAQDKAASNRRLSRLNADLENIVEERSRELQAVNDELQTISQEVENQNQEVCVLTDRINRLEKKEDFIDLAGKVAHELNNVLSSMICYPELILLDLPDDSTMKPKIESILYAGQVATSTVQDLLTLVRSDKEDMRAVDMNTDVIGDLVDSAAFKMVCANHSRVSVETHLVNDLMKIKGNPTTLKKVLLNIVTNSMESLPKEGGKILITTDNRYLDQPLRGFEHVDEGDYVVLRILDYGAGLDREDLEHLFEPFYITKEMGYQVSGLSMAVVREIVQEHQGYLNVETGKGLGVCFELFFPVNRNETDAGNTTIAIDRYMGQGETVLVIDDIEEQRKIASTLLSRLNYKVHSVDSGEQALVFLDDTPVDVLVLDMIMDPGMDGLETYMKIVEKHPGQKAIIASGFSESERVKKAQRLGAGRYIRKPYTLEKIALGLKNELVS
jgi:signal transduction histidine kinase